jgi:DNA-binding transcriptional LysR family regulator
LGERLFDRSSNKGLLTEAGKVLQAYAQRLSRLSDEAQVSVGELRELQRGRLTIGANEAAIPTMMPIIATFRRSHPEVMIEIRRVHARDLASELVHGGLDFGVTTFMKNEPRLGALALARDEMVAVVYPEHPFAGRRSLTLREWAREPIIVHNESTMARERIERMAESSGTSLNVKMALPTLAAIKVAVAMQLGISMMPRRCVQLELERRQLVGVSIPEVRRPHPVRLLYRRTAQRSHAAVAFLRVARESASTAPRRRRTIKEPLSNGPMNE